jgi:SOS-response transcriptional repressor LexA
MHPIQAKLVDLLKDQGSVPLKLREIGRKIWEIHPQTVKNHIDALEATGKIVKRNGFIVLNQPELSEGDFVNVPFYGLATCGSPRIQVDDAAWFIKLSRRLLPTGSLEDYFLVKAVWNSMDQAAIWKYKKHIEDGDLVLVNQNNTELQDGAYVITIIEGCANIKKSKIDKEAGRIALLSESSDEYYPIILYPDDNYQIKWTVEDVIKTNF